MYKVWTNWKNKDKRLCVAGSDTISVAVHYAYQYTEEGPVTIRKGNKTVVEMVQGSL